MTGRCQRDFDDPTLGLEQSTNTFVLPLSKYIVTPEWTFGFWVYIESVIGSGTSIFTQACSTATAGTLSLTKVGTDEYKFVVYGTENTISFPNTKHKIEGFDNN